MPRNLGLNRTFAFNYSVGLGLIWSCIRDPGATPTNPQPHEKNKQRPEQACSSKGESASCSWKHQITKSPINWYLLTYFNIYVHALINLFLHGCDCTTARCISAYSYLFENCRRETLWSLTVWDPLAPRRKRIMLLLTACSQWCGYIPQFHC